MNSNIKFKPEMNVLIAKKSNFIKTKDKKECFELKTTRNPFISINVLL